MTNQVVKVTIMVGFMVFFWLVGMSLSFGQYLHAGDQFPELTVKNVDNWEGGEIEFSKLRGKLIILDFWTVYCAACIQDMPKMERLQEEFGASVQIVLVTNSSVEQVENLKSRSEILRSVKLPMIVGDSLLTNLFSFRTVPTHVWIDEDGMVAQVTGPYTTQETLNAHLAGLTVELVQKRESKKIDLNQPLVLEDSGRHLTKLQYYSAIYRKINDDIGYWGVNLDPKTRKSIGIKIINQPILSLYAYAHSSDTIPFDYQNGRIILEVKDKDRFIAPKELTNERARWLQDNSYCYESYMSNTTPEERKKAMQVALDQYFGLDFVVEKRIIDCYVLYCQDSLKFEEAKKSNRQANIRPSTSQQLYGAIGAEISTLGMPLVAEFKYEGTIQIVVPRFDGDLVHFNKYLANFGLEVKEEKRRLDMLVFR